MLDRDLYVLEFGGDHPITYPQGLKKPVVGGDIVELNPERDPMGIATMVAAKLLKETVACMLAWNQSAT